MHIQGSWLEIMVTIMKVAFNRQMHLLILETYDFILVSFVPDRELLGLIMEDQFFSECYGVCGNDCEMISSEHVARDMLNLAI